MIKLRFTSLLAKKRSSNKNIITNQDNNNLVVYCLCKCVWCLFIRFCDGTARYVFEDGVEKTYFPDGSVQTVDINRIKTITHANGE